MIKNIVFDIGNVLAGFGWEAFYRQFGFEENIFQRLAAATVKSPFWNEFDRGDYSTEEIVNEFIRNDSGIEVEIRRVFANVEGMIVRYEYALPWLTGLRERGYGIYIISNLAQKIFEDCQGALDFIDITDGAVLSFQDKIIKPSPEIYQLLCSRFSLMPEECVFIDDLKVNIEAAQREGMEGIIFHSIEQAKDELNQILGR